MLSRTQKEQQVTELRDKFSRASSIYVADYCGLDVQSTNKLRRKIRAEKDGKFEYRVAKLSVLKLAAVDSDVAVLAKQFVGPTAIALAYDDPVGLAKIISEFAKEHGVFEIKGGVVNGEEVDPAQIAQLATLPSIDVLRGQIIGLVQAPATQLVRLLVEPGTQLARLVEARRAQLGEAS